MKAKFLFAEMKAVTFLLLLGHFLMGKKHHLHCHIVLFLKELTIMFVLLSFVELSGTKGRTVFN